MVWGAGRKKKTRKNKLRDCKTEIEEKKLPEITSVSHGSRGGIGNAGEAERETKWPKKDFEFLIMCWVSSQNHYSINELGNINQEMAQRSFVMTVKEYPST